MPNPYYSSNRGRNHGGSYRTHNLKPAIYSSSSAPHPMDRNIREGLSTTALQDISKISKKNSGEEVKITNLQYAGSYNWIDAPTPTIIVPGSPPEWLDRKTPYQVHADDGMSFKDQNGHRYPSAVLLPLIRAVDHTAEIDHTTFSWATVDFVTDRNGLRKLMRWIDGTTSDFRIDMQLAGKRTVLLNRWENRTQEQMSGMTYGFNFERASTRPAPGCERATGHHRIIRYDFNGLQMVVRFEVDACIASKVPVVPSSNTMTNIDDLIGSLSKVNIGTRNLKQPPVATSTVSGTESVPTLTVLSGGSYVPQSAIIELTTRSVRRELEYDWKESYPQLFLSQTPHHFLAIHERGRFIRVNKRNLTSPELQDIGKVDVQPTLRSLRSILNIIKDLVVKHGPNGRLSLVCQGGELRVFERVAMNSCLPDEVMQQFDT